MEKVASHINEMQKIYEDYGSVFDQLVAEQTGHDKEVDTFLDSESPGVVCLSKAALFMAHKAVS